MNEMSYHDRQSPLQTSMVWVLTKAWKLDRVAMTMLRVALVIVLVWIGSSKFVDYEADSIVPLGANSPVMSFFYHHPAEYRTHMNKEGELDPSVRVFSGLGSSGLA